MVIMIGGVSLSTECVDPWVCERASPPLQVGCQLAPDVKAVSRLPRLSREPAILLVTSGLPMRRSMTQPICASASRWHSRGPRWVDCSRAVSTVEIRGRRWWLHRCRNGPRHRSLVSRPRPQRVGHIDGAGSSRFGRHFMAKDWAGVRSADRYWHAVARGDLIDQAGAQTDSRSQPGKLPAR